MKGQATECDNGALSRDHQWSRDGDVGTVGITDYAQSRLGEVNSAKLPEAYLVHELQRLPCGRK